jgi:protein-L-isoaspartate(D-aspartate) O-methyltransferase
MSDFATARENMVENQLRPSEVDDPRVIEAFREVPREVFLPARLRSVAYQDEDIDLGGGRHLIEPLVLARLMQVGRPSVEDVALVVGCHTGYAAAMLSKLVATVFLLVPDEDAVAPIEARFDEFGFDNIVVQVGRAADGLANQAPFNLVLLAGSVVEAPAALLGQLDEGGRLAAVVETGRAGKVTVFTRVGGVVGKRQLYDARIPAIAELVPRAAFEF